MALGLYLINKSYLSGTLVDYAHYKLKCASATNGLLDHYLSWIFDLFLLVLVYFLIWQFNITLLRIGCTYSVHEIVSDLCGFRLYEPNRFSKIVLV